MKGKTNSKAKRSLQKTASSVINIHTHRNSNISDTLPFYFYDSVASIRSTSMSKSNQNYQSCNQGLKRGRERTVSKNREKGNEQRQLTQMKKRKGNNLNGKSRRALYQLYSDQHNASAKPALSHQLTQIQRPSHQLKQFEQLNFQSSKGDINNQAYLISALKRTNSVLNSYRVYSQQLQLDCKKYKSKYAEALRKLKKYRPK